MDPLKVVEKVTNEIIGHLNLTHFAKPFIKKIVTWVYVAGWEEGLQHRAGRKPVAQMDQYGKVIKIHRSLKDASMAVGTHGTNIKNVCKGKKNSHKGFYWRYVENTEQIRELIEGWQKKL